MIEDGGLAVSVAVMAHPSRAGAVREMVRRHPELGIRAVFDPEPDRGHSLRTALDSWAALDPGATHHLVLQDDVALCAGFAGHLLGAIGALPEAAISLFAEWGSRSAWTARLALLRGLDFAAVADPYTPTQALVLPAARARELVTDAAGQSDPDDIVIHRHLRAHGVRSVVTVPNLVEHDVGPSLTGNAFQGLRRSVCFAPAPERERWRAAVAGEDLGQVPHVSWMRLVAEWFDFGPRAEIGWTGRPLAERLPVEAAALRARFADDLRGADPDGGLRAALTDIVLFEVWLGCFALGLIGGVGPAEATARSGDPLWRAALATVFPGAFRRYLPVEALERVREAGVRLSRHAVTAGAETASRLDGDAVRAVAGLTRG